MTIDPTLHQFSELVCLLLGLVHLSGLSLESAWNMEIPFSINKQLPYPGGDMLILRPKTHTHTNLLMITGVYKLVCRR